MRFDIQWSATVKAPRRLYVVPERRVARARHIPPGRTLHLVDIENLVGGSSATCGEVAMVSSDYRRTAPVLVGDHVIVAAGKSMAVDAGLVWNGARLVFGRGVNGADRALLAAVADPFWVARHFDRVVLGSGDGIFKPVLASLRRLGVATGIVAPDNSISFALRRQADFVRPLHCPHAAQGAA